jgi:hypothetical protein
MTLRESLKQGLARFNLALELVGVRLEPMHYYSQTPSRRDLAQTRADWAKPLDLPGVHWDLDEQLSWLEAVTRPFLSEVEGLARYRALESGEFGPGYGPIESQLLHCVIRQLAPRRLVEIGSGLSTMTTLHAARLNASEGRGQTAITCVEPFPRDALRRVTDITLVAAPAQTVPIELFTDLGPGDVLFIDSTHAMKTGSELTRLYLEIVPRLVPGVVVHVHDVYLPYSYEPDILFNLFDWQETALVAALLTGNGGLKVLACMSGLHHDRRVELEAIFSDYRPCDLPSGLSTPQTRGHFPSSLWLLTA